jgi:hypothetical protein
MSNNTSHYFLYPLSFAPEVDYFDQFLNFDPAKFIILDNVAGLKCWYRIAEMVKQGWKLEEGCHMK